MGAMRFQERYIEKHGKVFDTWKKIYITTKLDDYSLVNLISHLNGLGEIIDGKIEQGRYVLKKHYDLREDILNAIEESEKVKCTCHPCQCGIYVKRVLEE